MPLDSIFFFSLEMKKVNDNFGEKYLSCAFDLDNKEAKDEFNFSIFFFLNKNILKYFYYKKNH